MKFSRALALATVMTVVATPVFAFGLSDVMGVVSGSKDAAPAQDTSGLISSLAALKGVSSEQAVGGTGALMGLAKNKLNSEDLSSLTQSAPGLGQLASAGALSGLLGNIGGSSAGGALGNVQSMGDVNSAFSKLGMDPALVSQFVPIILQYLGAQGTSGSLISTLTSLWSS